MELTKINTIVKTIFQKNLKEKIYPYGFKKKRGLSDKVATGTLYNSINTSVVKDGDNIQINLEMVGYGKKVDEGTLPGETVPLEDLLKWIQIRKLSTGSNVGDYMYGTNIQKNIKQFGIRPAPFIERSITQILSNPEITNIILSETENDIDIILNKIFK